MFGAVIGNQTALVKILLENGAETDVLSSIGKIFNFILYATVVYERNLSFFELLIY